MNNSFYQLQMSVASVVVAMLPLFVSAGDGMRWIDGRDLPIEGRVFGSVDEYYDRLPASVTTNVNAGVRELKHHTSGEQFRFATDSKRLTFQWMPRTESPMMDHMPATGHSGIDVYARDKSGQWHYKATGRIRNWKTGGTLEIAWEPGVPCLVNLPLYNGLKWFRLGVDEGAKVSKLPPRPRDRQKPVVFYGTSITQGGCASRPGMSFVNIVGRNLDVPVVNLGFSGAGLMELEMSEHLAAIDAGCYVLDCLWNMDESRIRRNCEPFIRNLRRLKPNVPIVMAERCDVFGRPRGPRDEIMRTVYEKLVAEGWRKLAYLSKDRMYVGGTEGTVDGAHPNDWGMMSMADAFGAAVATAMGLDVENAVSCCSDAASPSGIGFSPDRFTMLNIIPAGDAKLQAQDAIEYEARTGNPHVLYVMTLHPQGKPASRVVDEAIKNYRIFVKTLEGSRVKPGILLQSILGHWARVDREVEPWQRTIDIEGKVKRFCPLDRDYQAYIRETAARLAAEHPCLILTDDDVRAFSPKAECFCPLHRTAFNRRTGRDLKTTDEFRELIAQSKLHSPEHDAFVRLQRDTVLGVCKLIREGIDSVDPAIPAGACQPGWPWDGVRAHEYAKVLAAKGQTPFLRLGNGQYVEKSPKEDNLDKAIMTMAWQDFYGDGIFLLDEADTYPHNPWAKCAITMHSKMLMSAFIGLKGAKLWFVNCHKQGFPISRNYTEVLAERRGYYDAVAALTVNSKLSGIVIPCHPDFPSNTVGKDAGGLWDFNQWCTTSFGVYGIPMRAAVRFDEDAIYALGGWHAASRFSDDQIRAMLSHRALIDGGAAVNLINRGFGKLIGVELSGEKPQFVCERDEVTRHGLNFPMSCEPPIFKEVEGAKIRSSLIWTPPPGSGEADVAAPSATLFRNSLGGTVVTVAYRNADMPRDHRHSESRKAWLERRIMDLNDGVPYDGIADTAQNTLVLVRRGTAGEDYVLFSNLSFDPARSVRLKFAKKPAKVEVLALNGVWKRADWTWKDGVLDVAGEIPCYNERVLRIVR